MSNDVAGTRGASAAQPIAIIGMGCRFPGGANTPAAFWNVLLEGRDTITEIPRDRYDTQPYFDPSSPLYGKLSTAAGGYLDRPIGDFDPSFFGIAPREAVYMDPQHRLLLEVAWEALEDAGQVPSAIAGSRTGVFVGIWTSDYETRLCRSIADLDLHVLVGSARYAAAGRLSFAFDLRGPSISLDTACSSAMVAVHQACESIWTGSASMALAGGVNVILEPFLHTGGFRSGSLSEHGRCKFGDASASGYVRSEGAGMVVLKPLAQALADNDPIYAVIRGTAVNNDGRSSGQITAPGIDTQVEVMRQALARADIAAAQLSYVEAHGTGTAVGDPIEITALARVLGEGRSADRPCLIGSAKTNFGHAEAAAGMVSLMKAALCLKHREIPPSLHFDTPNPKIAWADLPLRLAQERTAWPDEAFPAFAGANSFGITGTNAHVVLQEAPRQVRIASPDAGPRLIPISAHAPEALRAMAKAHLEHVRSDTDLSLQDLAYTAARRRTHHAHRLAVVAATREELVEQLEAFVAGETRQGVTSGRVPHDAVCRPVFVFSGMGPQWWAMGRELFETEPVYRAAVEACDAYFEPLAGWSIVTELMATEADSRMGRTAISQPTGFAVQVGLFALWRAWGIEPAAIVGHSTGEVAAAYAAGVLSLADAVKVIYHRSRLQDRTSGQGTMAAADLDPQAAEALAEEYAGRVSIAAVNGPTSVTLSGEVEAIQDVVARLESNGTFVRQMRVDSAFHSPLMDSLRDELLESLGDLAVNPPSGPIVSTVTGARAEPDAYGTAYWWCNMRGTVYFAKAIGGLIADGFRDFLELSPHPVLGGSIQGCLAEAGVAGRVLTSLRRKAPERAQMLESLGALYTLGYPLDWTQQHPVGSCVSLPTYQWQREHVWFAEDGQVAAGGLSRIDRLHPFLGAHLESALQPGTRLWEVDLDLAAFAYLKDHRVGQSPVFPAAGYFDLVLAAGAAKFGRGGCAIEDARLQEALFLSAETPRIGQLVITSAGVETTFQFLSRHAVRGEAETEWTLHASGRLVAVEAVDESPTLPAPEDIRAMCDTALSASDHYAQVRERRITYGPHFQAVHQVWLRPNEALGKLRLDEDLQRQAGAYQVHPVLLDAAFQVLLAALAEAEIPTSPNATYLPVGVRRLRLHQRPTGSEHWAYARLDLLSSLGPDTLVGNVDILDPSGRCVMTVEGLVIQKVERPIADQIRDWLYEPVWRAQQRSPSRRNGKSPLHGRWLVFADRGQMGDRLVEGLVEAGARPVVVRDAAHECAGGGDLVVAPGDAFAMQALMEAVTAENEAQPIEGIIHAWGATRKATLSEAQVRGPVGLMHLIQSMSALAQPLVAPLWILTCGATPVSGSPRAELAPVWGLANVVVMEHPELKCRCVDLGDASDLRGFFEELWNGAGEAQVALRGDERFVARLVRAQSSRVSPPALALRSDGTYLISGGLGGLGLAVAEELIQHGAGHVVLLGRHGPSAEAQATIGRLQQSGAGVYVMRCDVAQAESVAGLIAAIAEMGLAPLRGVIHAAGVLDDGLLLQQDRARFERVAAPKVDGAWNMHCQTLDQPLDLFVLFSSAAVTVGNPGQSIYVAANAFMDALAHARRAQGLPAVSINWGAWSEVGMAAAQGVRGDRLATQGLTSLTPPQALAAFWAVLAEDRTQVAIMPFDVRRWCQSHPVAAEWSFLSDLVAQAKAEAADAVAGQERANDSIYDQLHAAPPAERRALLEQFVLEQVAGVLKMAPGRVDRQAPMNAMGFDSLMSLELRSRLEAGLRLSLSLTIAFNYPTVCALGDFLAAKFGLDDVDGATPDGAGSAHDVLLTQILQGADALSTGELAELVSGAGA